MNGVDLNAMRELFNAYQKHSDEWRISTDKKFEKIFEWLEKLPCDSRGVITEQNNRMFNWLWSAIGLIFTLIGGSLIMHLLGKL